MVKYLLLATGPAYIGRLRGRTINMNYYCATCGNDLQFKIHRQVMSRKTRPEGTARLFLSDRGSFEIGRQTRHNQWRFTGTPERL
jgi:uncharacterized protein (DUF488 family)